MLGYFCYANIPKGISHYKERVNDHCLVPSGTVALYRVVNNEKLMPPPFLVGVHGGGGRQRLQINQYILACICILVD